MCTNACQCSCGNGCGPATMCGGHCTSSTCSSSGCVITCEGYCMHNNCGFSCGGNDAIETNPGCLGYCTSSSSCSATGRHYYETG